MGKLELGIYLALPVVAGFLLQGNDYALTILAFMLIYGVLAMATTICTGHAGQVTLAQAGFFGIGAYAAVLVTLDLDLPFVFGFIASLVVSGAVGYALGVPILRVKGHFLGLITLAFTQVVYEVALHWESLTGGFNGLFGMTKPVLPIPGIEPLYSFILILTAFWFAVLLAADNLVHSRYGRAMHMLKVTEQGAQACGINVSRYKSDAFALSAALCGGAGAFYGHFIGYIGPDSFTIDVSIAAIAMAIVGGIGDLRGAILGSVLLTFLNEPLRNHPLYQPVMYGAVILLALIVLPEGIVPSVLRIARPRPPA
ncbi:branched-chain amino acid ABC transporter permease [Acidisoma cellulosilytica]|uniref:Branched-chain amino acid ABC transporter permease n=1 Tax=Acidisoma cellulosilyticum TaxID=2802395 RepID=A0A963Z8F4_9PROT|nr:branched-chain amino acid ABC transporter permease [Acidisoma cellulosilyticum]MCB8883782.1 branched-chain amino acid ABC transporter permease [Acidisoma cellulosilyticum]